MLSEEEKWLSIPDFEGLYEASSLGRIRRLTFTNGHADFKYTDPKILKSYIHSKTKYELVRLHKNGKCSNFAVHRAVASAFHGPCPKGLECAHLDGNRQNNRPENLKWVTKKINHKHKWLHGTQQAGEQNPISRFKETQVYTMRIMYSLGATCAEIGAIFDEKTEIIHHLVNNKSWKHLKDPMSKLLEDNGRLREALELIQSDDGYGMDKLKYHQQMSGDPLAAVIADNIIIARQALGIEK